MRHASRPPLAIGDTRRSQLRMLAFGTLLAGGLHPAGLVAEDRVPIPELQAVAAPDWTAASDRAAAKSAANLQSLPSEQVTQVLNAFGQATPRGKNWLRALAADVADNGPFPREALQRFFDDRSGDPDARYVAFQLLAQQDPALRTELLAEAQTDPSLPVRYLRIRDLLDEAAGLVDERPEEAKALATTAIENGRSPAQLERAAKLLEQLDVPVDLAETLGMMRSWLVIGPFDNTDSEDFDTAYVPENRYLELGTPIDPQNGGEPAAEKGKRGPVQWQKVSSDDSQGMVDLNAPLSNEKDAVAYAYQKLAVQGEQLPLKAEARLGSITANKVWVNGQLVISNNVYHSGTRIDQYVGECQLVPGENTVLIKVLQNAQTEPWAQDWQFQFRLTHPDGRPIKTTPVEVEL